jgi:hypothetical protein
MQVKEDIVNQQVDVYQAIKAIIVYLSNNPDIYMVADNPYFPLARAVMLEGQVGAFLRKQQPQETV